ncbi:hypothetical protein [Sphingomonas bisphenolicum]|uniref:Transposase n=1 Tax=Sphingomonas bisphenolicum TaxID=296544 RepID=A0ABN5WD59_9SPHN|nr:hypothetical protein [Sphingomonas bisphenolicum]BBF70223.1 hypothetical protein SBA_ch1_24230 [Sphingomonas bisphenolicum]
MRPRLTPYSPAELRAMRAEGDSVAQIHARAYRLDRSMSKDRIRAILFEQAAA